MKEFSFNHDKYASKFLIKRTGLLDDYYYQQITCNMDLKTLRIDLFDKYYEIVEIYNYNLSETQFNELLRLLLWDEFEKYKDSDQWGSDNIGYRDCWGYEILLVNDNKDYMLQFYADEIFDDYNKPPYEKLIDWIKRNFAKRKEFADIDKRLIW